MEDTWAAGPIELLRHAHSHMGKGSGFDRRIAFVSVDNAVELTLQAYLTMPARTRKAPGPKPEEFAAVEESFVGLLDLCLSLRADAFAAAPPLDIEHYHRIRNRLYHEGTGLTVSDEYLARYFQMAAHLLTALLGVAFTPAVDRLSNLKPEVRLQLLEEVRRARSAEHSAAVKAGLEPVKRAGRLGKRGVPTSGLTEEEAEVAKQLHEKKWGYKRIADELTRRRKQNAKKGEDVPAVAFQKVRRKLVEMGLVTPVAEKGYL